MTDDIRQRHVRVQWSGTPDTCSVCGTEWPCDAIRMTDARDEWEAHSRRWMEHAGKVAAERDAANADAERLAALLLEMTRETHDWGNGKKWHHPKGKRYEPCDFEDCVDAGCVEVRAALAAHEERVR